MKILGSYKNNDYTCTMFSDGTKIRWNDKDSFNPIKPESIDLKITNMCNMECGMCHENSTPDGKHGDILNLPFIETMFPYSEIAIGGGNPLTHPDLIEFLEGLKERKIIASMTVNQVHFMHNIDLLKELTDKKLIYGLGISYIGGRHKNCIDAIKQFPNAVVHVINGIVHMDSLEALANNDLKILVLGYKEFRQRQNSI